MSMFNVYVNAACVPVWLAVGYVNIQMGIARQPPWSKHYWVLGVSAICLAVLYGFLALAAWYRVAGKG